MSRHGRGGRRQQQRQRQRGPSTAMSVASIPQQAPSADALASGRVVTLSNQASARGVASYAVTASALQAQSARQVAQVSASQPGVMTSTEKQYPAMPKIARKSPLLESLGAPGTAIFQGIITNDDYNPDFYWRDAVEIYDQMVRNDGQIMAIVQQLELPIRRATWTIEPFSARPGAAVSDRDKEVASFIETCLFHDLVRTTADGRRVYQKWDDILRHALMMLRYGFAAFEKVWRKEDGWVKLAHLMPMLPMSVYRWWVGRDNELVGIQQYTFKDYTYRFVDIPADKVLLFTHRMEGQNYEGFSLLRAAYKHWYYKDQFYKIDAIGLERNAIAVPYIELPASFNESDVSQAQAILANLRANESMGVTLPFGWKIAYIPGSEHYAGAALKSIEHHDILIARAVLAQFINLGSGETGTYNLAVDQRQDLLESLQAEAEYIEDTFNADLIPQLCDFNFSGLEGYPRIKASKLAQADITELVDSISKLKAKDANFLTPDPELEDWIRDQMGMPKATRSIIAGENPTAPTTPQRPDATQEQQGDHSDAESAPVEGKKAPESQSADGSDGGASGGDDDGGEAGVSGAAAQASERDAGAYLLFNPNHDAKGKFASGGASNATSSAGHTSGSIGSGPHVHDTDGQGRENLKTMFGKSLDDAQIKSLVGARPEDEVSIGGTRNEGTHFIVSGANGSYHAERTLEYDHSDRPIMHNDSLTVHETGHGLGTHLFGAQVDGAQALGVNRIETYAARAEGMNGYYTWARLGYDAPLENNFALPEHLGWAQTVSDLMLSPEGRDYWKANGYSTEMTFDLSPHSDSMQTFNAYRTARGAGNGG